MSSILNYIKIEQLLDAIKLSDRAYLFDNSGQKDQCVAEYNGVDNKLRVSKNINWVNLFVLYIWIDYIITKSLSYI